MNSYPIVLAQGIARFDFLREFFVSRLSRLRPESVFSDHFHYFRNIASHLRANDFEVQHTSVSWAARVGQRSRELRDEVSRVLAATGKQRVNIIAHSMGGLDARHMIVDEGMAEKVASLTTIGTPHAGTSFADWGLANRGDQIIRALEGLIDLDGFFDLSTEACSEFNRRAREAEAASGVFYQAYGSFQERDGVFRLLRPSWDIIHEREGANDGLVPLGSQMWPAEESEGVRVERKEFPVQADHLNQAGWWDSGEEQARDEYEGAIKAVYLDIARNLPAD